MLLKKELLKKDGQIIIIDELVPRNLLTKKLVNIFRLPVFKYLEKKTNMKYHGMHDFITLLYKFILVMQMFFDKDAFRMTIREALGSINTPENNARCPGLNDVIGKVLTTFETIGEEERLEEEITPEHRDHAASVIFDIMESKKEVDSLDHVEMQMAFDEDEFPPRSETGLTAKGPQRPASFA